MSEMTKIQIAIQYLRNRWSSKPYMNSVMDKLITCRQWQKLQIAVQYLRNWWSSKPYMNSAIDKLFVVDQNYRRKAKIMQYNYMLTLNVLRAPILLLCNNTDPFILFCTVVSMH